MLCLAGAIKLIRKNDIGVLDPGDFLIIGPGDRHRCCFGLANQHSRGLTFVLRPAVLRSILEPCLCRTAVFRETSSSKAKVVPASATNSHISALGIEFNQ